jgi:3-hydroxyisobutyrate dehydrogenase-like beta-hydroxyacid dehydrogenase
VAPAVSIGLLHPGEMGAMVAASLRNTGQPVLWASAARSAATAARAEAAGLQDCGTAAELAARSQIILSLCPPQAAADVARSVAGFRGIYVDANAISPAATRTIGQAFDRYVDGAVIGPPPTGPGTTRLYLSGREAGVVAERFADSFVEAIVVSQDPGAASALKMAFAAWTKGTAALLLAIRSLAREAGVEQALLEQWARSHPHLIEQSKSAAGSAVRLGWRWCSEMEEIGQTFTAAGLPDGFGRAAAEIYRRSPRGAAGGDSLERVLAALAQAGLQLVPDSGTDASSQRDSYDTAT